MPDSPDLNTASLGSKPRRWWLWPLSLIGLLAVAVAIDGWVRATVIYPPRSAEFGYLLRIFGFFPTWVLGSAIVFLLEWDRRRGTLRTAFIRAATLFLSTAAAGLLAGLIKIIVRRTRPLSSETPFEFRSFDDRFFDATGLSFPSEHAAVAFAAALTLTAFYPRAWPVWWAWAIGCGYIRVVTLGHYVSDIIGALIVAAAVAGLASRIVQRRSRAMVQSP